MAHENPEEQLPSAADAAQHERRGEEAVAGPARGSESSGTAEAIRAEAIRDEALKAIQKVQRRLAERTRG